MELGDFETTIKVIVVGNGGVGKSSMTARYCKGVYTDTYKKTIGVDFLEKTIELDSGGGESVKLMIWDTAGQEEFDALTSSYYRGAGACAIVFSTIDRASFEAVAKWKRKVEAECDPGIVMALVQNKTDLIDQATMTAAEVEATARKLGVRLFQTCVKENVNVAETFEYLASQFILRGGDTSGTSAVAAIGDYSRGGPKAAGVIANEEDGEHARSRLESHQLALVGEADGGVSEGKHADRDGHPHEEHAATGAATIAASGPGTSPSHASTASSGTGATPSRQQRQTGIVKLGADSNAAAYAKRKSKCC